jgi:hypothetical protein
MALIQTLTPRPLAGGAARHGIADPPAGLSVTSAELASILDDLVDAIDVRESYEPEVAGWDTASTIRRLERELARTWAALPRPIERTRGARRWQP